MDDGLHDAGDIVTISMPSPGVYLLIDPAYQVDGIRVELEERFPVGSGRFVWRAQFVDRLGHLTVEETQIVP